MPRHVNFTYFNPPDGFDIVLDSGANSPAIRYVVWQHEICPDTGTPHIQGYAEFYRTVRYPQARALLGIPGAHTTPIHVNSSRGHCRRYCQLEEKRTPGTDCHEIGEWIGGQGHRSDIRLFCDGIVDGSSTMQELAREYPVTYVRNGLGLHRLDAIIQPASMRPGLKVLYLFGPTGTGKTTLVHDLFPSAYWWPIAANGNTYASGYCGQTICVFDEFTGDRREYPGYNSQLRMVDEFPMDVNCQGSSRAFCANIIVFTSNIQYNQLQWIPHRWDTTAWCRRIEDDNKGFALTINDFDDVEIARVHIEEFLLM